MKSIIILLVISFLTVYSQDFEPIQIPFTFQGSNKYYLSADSSYFQQKNFILGWAWSCGRKMSEAMFDNQAHVGSGSVYQKSWIKNNTNLIINAVDVFDAGGGLTGSNSQSMCYSPILRITNTGGIINNPKHYVFGFKHIDGEIIHSTIIENN